MRKVSAQLQINNAPAQAVAEYPKIAMRCSGARRGERLPSVRQGERLYKLG
jgi:hypothetical protein